MDRDLNAAGLIPAHAGKTLVDVKGSVGLQAHPRSRGENASVLLARVFRLGSSPLTRGKRGRRRVVVGEARLIPAHAGKTMRLTFSRPLVRAHPRSRGENLMGADGGPVPHGSSPLTRGKHGHPRIVTEMGRLIPAHAGKTVKTKTGWPSSAAHPRSRGENFLLRSTLFCSAGSSPLTRGKRV